MTTSQETISDTARHDREEFSHAMEHWIDNYFHAWGRILIIQRDFWKSCLSITPRTTNSAASKKY